MLDIRHHDRLKRFTFLDDRSALLDSRFREKMKAAKGVSQSDAVGEHNTSCDAIHPVNNCLVETPLSSE